jgi:hypothetical protein
MTLAQGTGLALDAYEQLTGLAEEIEDEWTYVNDLASTWRRRMEDVIAERGDDVFDLPEQAAIERAIAEIDAINDPHRAIDWLSTFPQVVLMALGERP